MKKMILNPLRLDKETIALLDSQQLNFVIGGMNDNDSISGGSISCCTGSVVANLLDQRAADQDLAHVLQIPNQWEMLVFNQH